jgi:hypothetical protein
MRTLAYENFLRDSVKASNIFQALSLQADLRDFLEWTLCTS